MLRRVLLAYTSWPPIIEYLSRALAKRGIETRSFFVPMHRQPIYAEQLQGQRFPVAEQLCRSGFYLPTHESLDERDVDWICQQIADIRRSVGVASAVA